MSNILNEENAINNEIEKSERQSGGSISLSQQSSKSSSMFSNATFNNCTFNFGADFQQKNAEKNE